LQKLTTEQIRQQNNYVTRPYATRHGRGPLPNEITTPPCSKFEDKTNTFNKYQEYLRFGLLDLDTLAKTIHKDLKRAKIPHTCSIALTCADQIGEK
jgi:adenylosuccinate synthase